ncbi:MAG TPA: hypothetical protein VF390_00720 [Patescibacteria group bacterium]
MLNKEKQLRFLIHWKDLLASSFALLVCLLLFLFFPVNGPLQNLSRSLFFLLVVPALYVKIILKKKLSDFGFAFSASRKGFLWLGGTLLAALLIAYVLVNFTGFKDAYINMIPFAVYNTFRSFLFYELLFVNFLLFLHEAFFNGFVLFTFKEAFGYWSILIVTLSFLIFLALFNSLNWGMVPSIIAITLGTWMAYITRSFIYSYLMGFAFMIILDAYIIHLFK